VEVEKLKKNEQPNLRSAFGGLTAAGQVARIGLELLAIINLVAQGLSIVLVIVGGEGLALLPMTFGAVVALFLLYVFYLRWLFPFIQLRHVLILILLKELSWLVLLSFIFGVIVLLYWFSK
jgi:hypothetical protein